MSGSVTLYFADSVAAVDRMAALTPTDARCVAASGAEDRFQVTRGEAYVDVFLRDLSDGPRLASLEAPATTLAALDVPLALESEWLAAEMILLAAERSALVIEDFAGEVVTPDGFEARVAKRRTGLFYPDGAFDFEAAARHDASGRVLVILPGAVPFGQVADLARGLGGTFEPAAPGARVDRQGATIWLAEDRAAPHPDARDVVGAPPYMAVRLDVFRSDASNLLAFQLIETVAARWPLVVLGPQDQAMTLDNLRDREAMGAVSNLFSP